MEYSIHAVVVTREQRRELSNISNMKRHYPSGATKRKKKEEAKLKTDALPKLTSFFSVTTPPDTNVLVEGAGGEEVPPGPAVDAAGGGGEELKASCTDDKDDENAVEDAVSRPTAAVSDSDHPKESDALSDDPGLWPTVVNDRERCELVKIGPVQQQSEFPKNAMGRRFTTANYYMQMKNGERISRTWLVYSKVEDAAMCFCCHLFGKGDTQLSSTSGFNQWKNLQAHLKYHERSAEHVKNMDAWHTLNARLQSGTAIDQGAQNLINAEVIRCKEVMKRLLAIVCHLAQHNLAFRGHREKLFEHGNGNFLGQVQLMAKFDPVMKEHLWKIKEKQIADTYLSKRIQNELICLVAQCTTDAIVERVRRAKYYAVIMDCTPDVSHNEQLSVLLRIVNCELTKGVSIHEHFMGFLLADDTTGQGLLQLFLGHLEKLGLDLSNCRGQSYDNGSNMQGKTQGVQARMLQLNPKSLCVPSGSHTLNLVVGDAAKSSTISLGMRLHC